MIFMYVTDDMLGLVKDERKLVKTDNGQPVSWNKSAAKKIRGLFCGYIIAIELN